MARKKRKTQTNTKPLFDDLSPHARQAIWAVVIGIFAVFFLFSLLDYAGPVGEYTEITLRVLFGTGAWLAPLACCVYIYVLLNPSEEDNEVSRSKKIGTALIFVSLLGAFELGGEGLGGWIGWLLEAPLTYLLGSTVSGVLLFGLVMISIFLLFNTGLKMPFAGRKKEPLDDDSDIESLDLPEEDSPEEENNKAEDEEAATGGLAAIYKKVAKLEKQNPNEIVVKNF